MKAKFKHRKIMKYLNSKDESQYNCLDNIFKYYIGGHLESLLKSYHFSNIRCFFQIARKGNYLMINCRFCNLSIDIEFDELDFDYSIYLPGVSAEEFGKSFITKDYDNDFNIEQFFDVFFKKIESDERLLKNN